MATITTSAGGAVNVGSNWVGGTVPGITDDAVIAHAMTVPTGYTFKPASITTTLTSGNAITVQGTGQIGDATDRVALTIARGFYGNLIYKNSVGPLLVYAKDIHFICGSVSATGTACIASVGTTCYDGVIVDAAGFDVYVKRENDAGLGKGYVALSVVGNFSQAVATLICETLTLVNVGNDRDDELYGVAAISTGVSSAVAKLTAEEVYLSVDDGATGARGAETYAIYSQSSINAISEIDISDYYYQAANSDTGPWVTLASSEAGNSYGEIIFRRGFTIHENSVCILDCYQGTNADGSGKVYGDNESTPHTITNYGDLLVLCPDYLTDFRVVNVTSQAQAAMTCPLNLRDNVTVVPYVGTVVATPAEIEAYVQAALTSQGLTTQRAAKLDNSDVATSTLATPTNVLTQTQAALTAQGYTTTRAAKLDNADVATSTRSSHTAAQAGTDAASKILSTPANLLGTNASGEVVASNMVSEPDNASIADIKDKTDNLPSDPAGVSDLPSEPPTVVEIRTEMDSNSTKLASILEDTGTSIPSSLTTITNKVNLIGTTTVTYNSPAQENGEFIITAGDDYLVADSRALEVTIEDYSGPSLVSATCKMRLLPIESYKIQDADVDPEEFTTTISIDGTTIVTSTDITSAQSSELNSVPPAAQRNYVFQVVATTTGSKTITLASGKMTVLQGLGV